MNKETLQRFQNLKDAKRLMGSGYSVEVSWIDICSLIDYVDKLLTEQAKKDGTVADG